MQGNKAAKNRKKKSHNKRLPILCRCFYCQGNWFTRFILRTRSRKKYIKHYKRWEESARQVHYERYDD